MLHDYDRSQAEDSDGHPSIRSVHVIADPAHELLESRQVFQDFQASGGMVRVETRIKVNKSPWAVRSIVQENGVEVQEGPFAPIQEEFDASAADPDAIEDLRLEFARQALQGHIARCKQVQKALGKAPGKGRSKTIAVVVAVVLAVAGTGVAAYFLGPGKKAEEKLAAQAPPAAEQKPKTEVPAVPVVPDPNKIPPPATQGEVKAEEAPLLPPVLLEPPKALPPEKPVTAPKSQGASTPTQVPPPSRKPAPKPTGVVQEDRSIQIEDEEKPQPRESSRISREIVSSIQPSHYQLSRLQPGAAVYIDHGISPVDVPAEYLDLRSIRTANANQAAEEAALSFTLNRDAKIYVAHDRRIRKKPDWLQAFSRTGQQLTLNEPGVGTAIFDVFVREYPAGPVYLGSNIEWKGATRILRGNVLPKKMGMFLVFVEPR